jgi:hypothetical protein
MSSHDYSRDMSTSDKGDSLVSPNLLNKEEMSRGSQVSLSSCNDVFQQKIASMLDTFDDRDVQIVASHLLHTRRITTIERQKDRETQKEVEIKELRGYLYKKSPSFFAGWQVSSPSVFIGLFLGTIYCIERQETLIL